MAKLADIQRDAATSELFTRPVVFDLAGHEINARVRLVPADLHAVSRANRFGTNPDPEQLGDAQDAVAAVICTFLTEWDLEDDYGIIPLTTEAVSQIDFDFLQVFAQQLDVAVDAGPKGPSGSSKRPPKPKVSSRKS